MSSKSIRGSSSSKIQKPTRTSLRSSKSRILEGNNKASKMKSKRFDDSDSKMTMTSGFLLPFGLYFQEEAIMDPEIDLPDVIDTDKISSIRAIAEVFWVTEYEENLVVYWILETLAEVLRECQLKDMSVENQKISLIWVIYVLKLIKIFVFKRRQMFKILENLFFRANEIITSSNSIPSPYSIQGETLAIGIEERLPTDSRRSSLRKTVKLRSKQSVEHQVTIDINQSKRDEEFYLLIDLLYNIFGNRYKYEVIYQTFSKPIPVETINICDKLLRPPPEVPHHILDLLRPASPVSAAKSKQKTKSKDIKKEQVKKSENRVSALEHIQYLLPLSLALEDVIKGHTNKGHSNKKTSPVSMVAHKRTS